MRAAQLTGYKEPFEMTQVATPEPGPGEVLVRVAGAGVCHSDLHLWSGELPMVLFDRLEHGHVPGRVVLTP